MVGKSDFPLWRFTRLQWFQLCERYGFRCLRCGKEGFRQLQRDHIVPVSQNGTGELSNCQPLCVACNSWKGDRTIDFRPKKHRASGLSRLAS